MANRKSRKKRSKAKSCRIIPVRTGSGSDIVDVDPLVTFTLEENMEMGGSVQQVFGMVELLSKILDYLPTSDIKSSNGVSSLWRQEARKLLLKRTRMDFGGEGQDLRTQIDSYIEEVGDTCHRNISIYSLGNNPAERFAISKLSHKFGYIIRKLYITAGNLDLLKSFTNLTMLSVCLDLNNFVHIPQNLIISSVKTLSFKVLQPQPLVQAQESTLSGRWYMLPISIGAKFAQSLLQICPRIEHLNLEGETQRAVLKLFEESPQPGHPTISRQLTGLALIDINFILSPPTPRLLNSLATRKLTMLKIDFREMDKYSNIFYQSLPGLQQMLTTFAPTLKHFQLYRIPSPREMRGRTNIPVRFPEMPKLEILEITHISIPFCKFTFDDESTHSAHIDYSKQFPALKKLSIKPVDPLSDGYCMDDSCLDGDCVCLGGSMLLCEMFFPEGTLPCHTLTRVDVDCISNIKHGNNCKQKRYCFCNKEGPAWNMLKRLMKSLPEVPELQKCSKWRW